MTASATASHPPRRDGSIIALVGLAHGVSHFFHLLLPPLFPWLMADFHLNFSRVGTTMTVFFLVSGVGQALAGLAVDRFGPVKILAGGMGCFFLAGLALFFATDYQALLLVAALAGLGNSVFHPADYTLLNRRVSPASLPHAFSVHGLAGNLGWGAAPVLLAGIAAVAGWRLAGLAAGCLALPFIALFLSRRHWLEGELALERKSGGRAAASAGGAFAFLKDGAVWLCFTFFFLLTSAFGAIQNFASPMLAALYGLSRGTAATMLSAYLVAGAAGIVLGGFLAKHRAQDRVIALALMSAAALALLLAAGGVPGWAVLPVMAAIGFLAGSAGPSRDMLVRQAATARFGQGSFGRIYGFVYSGLDTGLAAAPLIFGSFMDHSQYGAVLVGIALFQTAAVFTAAKAARA